jgi:hypothetical protein
LTIVAEAEAIAVVTVVAEAEAMPVAETVVEPEQVMPVRADNYFRT